MHIVSPLSTVKCILLSCFIADPHITEQPFHMLAVEHVPEEHLVSCQGFPVQQSIVKGVVIISEFLVKLCGKERSIVLRVKHWLNVHGNAHSRFETFLIT